MMHAAPSHRLETPRECVDYDVRMRVLLPTLPLSNQASIAAATKASSDTTSSRTLTARVFGSEVTIKMVTSTAWTMRCEINGYVRWWW